MTARLRVSHTGYLIGLFRLEAAQLVSKFFVSDMDSMHRKQKAIDGDTPTLVN